MLKKLATHDIQDAAELFTLTDKWAKASEGHAWHTPPTQEAGKGGKPDASVAAQGGGSKNKNKKKEPEVTSALVKRPAAMTEVRVAQCTTLRTTTLSARKSRNSQSSTVST
jgi:hypothetical protein